MNKRHLASVDSPASLRIVAVLEKHGPMTRREIAERAFVALKTLTSGSYMERLRDEGRVHIAEWKRGKRGPYDSVWAAGPGKDAPRPKPLKRRKVVRGAAKYNKNAFARRVKRYIDEGFLTPGERNVLDAINDEGGPLHYLDISARTGLSVSTIRQSGYLTLLHTVGLIRIHKWEKARVTGGAPCPLYGPFDNRPDAPRPRPIPNAQLCREWQKRSGYRKKQRALRSPNPVALIDPILAAFTGGKL